MKDVIIVDKQNDKFVGDPENGVTLENKAAVTVISSMYLNMSYFIFYK